jgi:hypothetical protein
MPTYFVSWGFQADIRGGLLYSNMTKQLKQQVLSHHFRAANSDPDHICNWNAQKGAVSYVMQYRLEHLE